MQPTTKSKVDEIVIFKQGCQIVIAIPKCGKIGQNFKNIPKF
jgi:hypothetical protein